MPQTSYSLDHAAAVAGQLVDRGDGTRMRGRYDASEAINFGRILELHTDGKLRHPQTAGAAGKLLGGCPYNASLPPTNGGVYGYAANDQLVPVLRKGQMWLEYAGAAPTVERAVNVKSSSTVATDRGKVTGDATSAVAGSEVYAIEGIVCIKVDTTLGLALCELNLPA